jgi:hypothetical protein
MTSFISAFQAIPTPITLSSTRSFVATTTIGSPVVNRRHRSSTTVDVASNSRHASTTLPAAVLSFSSSSAAPRRGRSSSSSSLGLFSARFSSLSTKSTLSRSQIETTRQLFHSIICKLRQSLAILLASFTLVLFSSINSGSGNSWRGVAPAHAASTATAITTSSSSSISTRMQRLNPFRTRTADELIDSYVQQRLFVDDIYDPVESTYREVIADSSGSGSYPTLLTDMATSVVGRYRAAITTTSSPTSGITGGIDGSMGRNNDGITGIIMKFSDILQIKLRLSASTSYILLATTGLVSVLFIPAMLGVLYQSIQRMQIDKGEMKMYGKISE